MKTLFIFLFAVCSLCVRAQQRHSDTLNLSDTSIHFIKIGEQIFEIKRTVTLEPVQPNYTIPSIRFTPSLGITPAIFTIPKNDNCCLNQQQ